MSEEKMEYKVEGKENHLQSETKLVRIGKADHEWLKEKAYIDRISIKEAVHTIIQEYKSKNK